jgi:hypothetical protein
LTDIQVEAAAAPNLRRATLSHLRTNKIKLWDPPFTALGSQRPNSEVMGTLAREISYATKVSIASIFAELESLRLLAVRNVKERDAAQLIK